MSSIDFTCPKCLATPGNRCRTISTDRTTDTHVARMQALMQHLAVASEAI